MILFYASFITENQLLIGYNFMFIIFSMKNVYYFNFADYF